MSWRDEFRGDMKLTRSGLIELLKNMPELPISIMDYSGDITLGIAQIKAEDGEICIYPNGM